MSKNENECTNPFLLRILTDSHDSSHPVYHHEIQHKSPPMVET